MTCTDITLDEFVIAMRSAFERAASECPAHVSSLYLADRAVSVRIAGPALADAYTPALAHLAHDAHHSSGVADLAIRCWERAATGVAPPPPPWTLEDFLPGGRIRGLPQHRVRVTYDGWTRTLAVYDREAREAFVHVADAATIPAWVTRSPLRNVLTWWAGDQGLAFLHAGAVAEPRGAVALAGASGSGKSTTALTCFADGWRMLGDDACIATTGAAPSLFPVYGFAKLERDALERLPELREHVVDPAAEQLLVAPPLWCGPAPPLRALVLPRIAGTVDTAVVPITRSEALRVLVPGSLLEGHGAGGTALQALSQLVQRVPCYRLELGTDRGRVVAAVRRVLDSS